MTLEENIKAIREIGKNPTNRISKMKKRIAELEQRLEQTEKDLTDYQFNYPKIKDLEQEKCELLGIIQGKDIAIQDLQKENAELKEKCNSLQELLNMFLRLHYNPIVDEHTLFCKVEQFLKEVEK